MGELSENEVEVQSLGDVSTSSLIVTSRRTSRANGSRACHIFNNLSHGCVFHRFGGSISRGVEEEGETAVVFRALDAGCGCRQEENPPAGGQVFNAAQISAFGTGGRGEGSVGREKAPKLLEGTLALGNVFRG